MRNVEFVCDGHSNNNLASQLANSRNTRSLNVDEVEEDLRCNLPTIPFPRRPLSASDVLEESALKTIAGLLEACPQTVIWHTKPRIYCILRLIGYKGYEPACQSFQDDDFDDLCIPFSTATLPWEIGSDASASKRFLELQPLVQTKAAYMNFDDPKAPAHRSISHGDLHFTTIKRLGQGGSSTVDLVRNKHSGLAFARKIIQRGVEEQDRRFRAKEFRNEIAALKKVSHTHLVSCVGTYTDQTCYAMILEPVADYTLKAMFAHDGSKPSIPEADLYNLPQYFGCLAMAVAFLHANEIRHNDIKPGNILIHDGRVLICDFGISRDWTSLGQATLTSGPILGATLSYSAPEVRLEGARGEPSDIWSLGRVYIEMLTVLSGELVENLDDYLTISDSSSGRRRSCERSSMDRLNDWLDYIQAPAKYAELVALASRMNAIIKAIKRKLIKSKISREPDKRPNATSVLNSIRRASTRFQCASCADSKVPALPTPRLQFPEEQEPTRGGAPTQAIDLDTSARWSETLDSQRTRTLSPQGSPRPSSHRLDNIQMRFPQSHSRNNSTASQARSASFDCSAKSLSRHDSVATAVSQTWQIQPDEELDLETTLLSYRIERGEATTSCKEGGIGDGALKMILYRTNCHRAWEVTRRMVIIDPDGETQTTRIFSNWLPLADLALCLYDDTVVMSWSDCNHDVAEPTRNYVETHSKKYDANKPNNKIVLKVASSATADAIALVRALCSPLPFSGHTVREPNQQMRLMSGERVGVFKVFNDDQDDMMMVVGDLAQGATTKIYSIPRQLDLTVAMRTDPAATKQLFQAVVSGLLTTGYASDAQHLSKMMHKKGCFHQAVQVSRKAVFTFAEDKALFDFLEAVTGWNLMFLARLKNLKEKRKFTHDCGAADMLLWQRGKRDYAGSARDVVVTFRLHKDQVSEKWISGLLPHESTIKKIEGVEASLRLKCSSEGDVLERHEMRAVSTKNSKAAGDKAVDAEQTSKFKVVFNNTQDVAQFQNILNESMRPVTLAQPALMTMRPRKNSKNSSFSDIS